MQKTSSMIFISYAHEDFEAAKRLYLDLKHAGLNIWLDKESLLPGQDWQIEIRRNIRNSSYFLALLSSNSVSKRGYVQREVAEALDVFKEFPESKVFIIPVRLDECKPSHEKLYTLQWADMFPCWKKGFNKILLSMQVPTEAFELFKCYLNEQVEAPRTRLCLDRYKITYEEAIKIAENALKIANSSYERGLARAMLGDFPCAEEDFGRSIELNPNNPDYYFDRGNIRLFLGGFRFSTN
jgi:tetratricopeptide (TPR) repeat protein